MKKKKELIILLAIIVILILYLVLKKQDRTHYQVPELPKIAKADITKIEISKQSESIVMTQKDNIWNIEPQGYPVDKDKADNMLKVIEELSFDELVSEAKSYFRYELDEDKKIIIKAWSGDTVSREFEIGKEATSYQHTFVKLPDDPNVFLARQAFRRRFDQTVDDLRDKTVLSFDNTEIKEINIKIGKKILALIQKDIPIEPDPDQKPDDKHTEPLKTKMVWQTPDGKENDKAKVDRLLSDFEKLRCDEYINDHAKEYFEDPIYTIQLKGLKEYAVSIFDKTDSDASKHPAVSSENDYPFLLPEWKVKNILKKPDEFLQKSKGPDKK